MGMQNWSGEGKTRTKPPKKVCAYCGESFVYSTRKHFEVMCSERSEYAGRLERLKKSLRERWNEVTLDVPQPKSWRDEDADIS